MDEYFSTTTTWGIFSEGPFGEDADDPPENPNPYRYTSRWRESADLYYYRARYYTPELGRFLSRDDASPRYEEPQALHRFAYVENNPVLKRDPSGHLPAGASIAPAPMWEVPVRFKTIHFGGEDKPGTDPGRVDWLWIDGVGFEVDSFYLQKFDDDGFVYLRLYMWMELMDPYVFVPWGFQEVYAATYDSSLPFGEWTKHYSMFGGFWPIEMSPDPGVHNSYVDLCYFLPDGWRGEMLWTWFSLVDAETGNVLDFAQYPWFWTADTPFVECDSSY